MAFIETHKKDCFRILGEEFEEVHRYLDEFAKRYPPPLFLEYHRKFRHHAKGVKEVREKFGLKAEMAAKIHIIRDVEIYVLREEFWKAVRYENLDKLYEIALKYCHDWQGPLNEKWL